MTKGPPKEDQRTTKGGIIRAVEYVFYINDVNRMKISIAFGRYSKENDYLRSANQ